jgi:hypothetical protein
MLLNITFYENHKEQLKAIYHGRYLIIRDGNVFGDFSTWLEACRKGLDLFKDDSFLIKFCT